jgi:hypothetical protein
VRSLAYAALAWAAAGISAVAQTTTTLPTYQTAVTTAMLGLAASQTAQLNAVNITIPTAATGNTAMACPVQLEFFDAANRLLKSASINNLAPGNAASLTLNLSEFPSGAAISVQHTLMRGVVRSNVVPSAATTPGVVIMGPISLSLGCTVFVSLQVFDAATGIGQAWTTDVRSLQPSIFPFALGH